MVRIPQTVLGRAGAILLGALLALVIMGYWAFRQGIEDVAVSLRERTLAERLVSIQRTIQNIESEDERDRTAHGLSSTSLEVHWSKVSLVLGNTNPTLESTAVEKRMKAIQPDLEKQRMRIGFADDGALGTGATQAYAHMLIVSLPLDDGSWVNFATPTVGTTYHMPYHILLTALVVGCGIALIAMVLLYRVTQPLRVLATAAEKFDLNSLQKPIDVNGPLEVRQAAHSFNAMGNRIRTLVAERTQALAAVSHDLRTPITRLRLRTEMMDDPELRAMVDRDLGEMTAMIDATLDYLSAGANPESDFRKVDIVSIVATIVNAEVDLGRDVELIGEAHALVLGETLSLKRAISNLIDNALKFGTAARISISVFGNHVSVIIADNGPGIPEADLTRVLEPFVRLESSRNRTTGGVGLGLAISNSIIRQHNGTLSLSNQVEGGLQALIRFPCLDESGPNG